MTNSFEEKGYKLLCSYQDSFFIKKEFYNLFNISEDILTLYFEGLRQIPRRIPFIQKYTAKVGLKNEIVDYILDKTKYKKYGWKNRKIWAAEQLELIVDVINKKEQKERNKNEL